MQLSRLIYLKFQKIMELLVPGACRSRVHTSEYTIRGGAILVVFLGMAFLAGQNVSHAQTINREYLIKAAYLFNFGRYTQWPEECWPDKEAPFVIGILGQNPFGMSLNQIASEKELQGRKILVRYFKNFREYRPCQILYISIDVPLEQRKAIITQLNRSKVLLVGEERSFLQEGGMVSFFLEENKVRFAVNLDPVDREEIKISSKVLKLAEIIKKEQPVE